MTFIIDGQIEESNKRVWAPFRETVHIGPNLDQHSTATCVRVDRSLVNFLSSNDGPICPLILKRGIGNNSNHVNPT